MPSDFRTLELFCGIGAVAVALDQRSQIVAAIDVNQHALSTYQHNQVCSALCRTIESLAPAWFREQAAHFWWLSPPCQPFTSRGHQRGLTDPRCAALRSVVKALEECQPGYVALENVPHFRQSDARNEFVGVLNVAGYRVEEFELCPTYWGVPNRRRRYYLLAARHGLLVEAQLSRLRQQSTIKFGDKHSTPSGAARLASFLDPEPDPDLLLDPETQEQYAGALDVVDDLERGITACFTSAYGRSIVRSGSYLRVGRRLRRFSPAEVLRLLGFPQAFQFPPGLSRRQQWALAGNSLSVPVVRDLLQAIPM